MGLDLKEALYKLHLDRLCFKVVTEAMVYDAKIMAVTADCFIGSVRVLFSEIFNARKKFKRMALKFSCNGELSRFVNAIGKRSSWYIFLSLVHM